MPPDAHQAHAFVPFENTAINQSIAGRFEQQVAQHPDRLAVVSAESQLTYAELNQVANRIARAVLSHLGEGEEPVALLFEEGAFIIAAILGVLKAGKIYVPLDPAFPRPDGVHAGKFRGKIASHQREASLPGSPGSGRRATDFRL
jgi:non-ribosomal peptide synthetase component F